MAVDYGHHSLESVLFHYDLIPDQIEEVGNGKVLKLTTPRGIFALKQTQIAHNQVDELIHAMHRLVKLGYKQAVPILPTKYGEYIVTMGKTSYYLMPWIQSPEYTARESREEKLIDQMGVIHRITVKTQELSLEQLEQSYRQLLTKWESKQLELIHFADQAEQKIYMSPFELTYLTHIHSLDQMAEAAKMYLNEWYEAAKEKGKYRSVLNHGRLSRSHALFTADNEPFLINFERVSLDTPARDLATFCRQSFPHAQWSEDEVVKWFSRYEHHLPLLDEEKQLLSSYLIFPEPIVFAVDFYRKKENQWSELAHVQRLEKRILSMRKAQRLTGRLLPVSNESMQ
ncbi:spore coat protein YsxE [Alkalicoccobacillus porphyridii]|uniref:Spore coat protein YsxE n=1 Tax=Alkalicoccobacillus porphyridii TaxID=2597270 RepID=A0A553ZXU5_9BACI|nr:spore coat protein YsxE [Alkalicoccobacillus porphyridii]TSB46254.1 spore coat protein YsxE [Alkalicoccobacillus porphyridii]